MCPKNKSVFLYPDYFDSTTATRRVFESSSDIFGDLSFFFWERNGKQKLEQNPLFGNVKMVTFNEYAPPRSLNIIWLTLKFQVWLLKKIIKEKPQFISAFYIYTILPAIMYKFIINRNCKVIYDPRDYFGVAFKFPNLLSKLFKLIDNIFIKLADGVIFPDEQFFTHYGNFKLKENRFFIIPNSTTDKYSILSRESIYDKYGILNSKKIVPIIGYFSEDRGRKMYYELIKFNLPDVHFIVAGAFRNKNDIDFFKLQSNVTYLGKVSYFEALDIMHQSALVPIVYDPASLNYKFAIPTKFYDSLMTGTPVIASNGQVDVSRKILDQKLGFTIQYNNTDEFLEVLKSLPLVRDEDQSNRIRNYFLSNCDFTIYKSGLRKFYLQFLQ